MRESDSEMREENERNRGRERERKRERLRWHEPLTGRMRNTKERRRNTRITESSEREGGKLAPMRTRIFSREREGEGMSL